MHAHLYYEQAYMQATKSNCKRISLLENKYAKSSYSAQRASMNMASIGIISQDSNSSADEGTSRKHHHEVVSPKPALTFDVSKFHRELKYVKLEGKSYNNLRFSILIYKVQSESQRESPILFPISKFSHLYFVLINRLSHQNPAPCIFKDRMATPV